MQRIRQIAGLIVFMTSLIHTSQDAYQKCAEGHILKIREKSKKLTEKSFN
jgi:hypothetical protein